MSKRDNVKARRRLKRPKKIYTNVPLDRGFRKARPLSERLEKQSTYGMNIGHKWAKAVYLDKTGRARVVRSNWEQIAIPLQKSKSPIESFNHWGLQKGNSPQKIQALMKKVDSYLISNRISPNIRHQIMDAWAQYKSAAWGFYRAKDPERKNYHREIIRQFELNSHRLGLRGTEMREGAKFGYLNNNVPKDIQTANYEYYEAWYNKMLDRAREQYELRMRSSETNELQETNTNLESDNEPIIPQQDLDWIMNADGDWAEYWFYSPDEITNIVNNMNGWTNAKSHYQEDLTRICNGAGYSVEVMYQHAEFGAPLPGPRPELVWDSSAIGSKGAKLDIWEIDLNNHTKARKK